MNQVKDPLRELMFDPSSIQRPFSPQWVPLKHVAEYVEFWIRREMPKEVRTRLRLEYPRSSLGNKVACTPELGAKMLTFLNKLGRDPRRGLDKGLKCCQDRLLDVFGPLTKNI